MEPDVQTTRHNLEDPSDNDSAFTEGLSPTPATAGGVAQGRRYLVFTGNADPVNCAQ